MPFRAAAATVATLMTAGLLLAPAAQANPGSLPKVTGTKLQSALLGPSAFGSGYKTIGSFSSGNRLGTFPTLHHISSMSCNDFHNALGTIGFGETALAEDDALNMNAGQSYLQGVYQFANSGTATSFFNAALAKFGKCKSFSGSAGKYTVKSVSKVNVGGHHAFIVNMTTGGNGITIPVTTQITLDSTDVFLLNNVATQAPSRQTLAALTVKLIGRVAALH